MKLHKLTTGILTTMALVSMGTTASAKTTKVALTPYKVIENQHYFTGKTTSKAKVTVSRYGITYATGKAKKNGTFKLKANDELTPNWHYRISAVKNGFKTTHKYLKVSAIKHKTVTKTNTVYLQPTHSTEVIYQNDQNQINSLNSQIANLQSLLTTAQNQSSSDHNVSSSEISSLQSELNNLKDKLESTKKDTNETTEKQDSSKDKNEDQSKTNQGKEDSPATKPFDVLDFIQKQLDKLSKKFSGKVDVNDKTIVEAQKLLNDKVNSLTEDAEKTTTEINELDSQLQELEQKQSEHLMNITKYNRYAEAIKNNTTESVKDLEAPYNFVKTTGYEPYLQEFKDIVSDLDSSKIKYDSDKAHSQSLKLQIQQAQSQLDNYNNQKLS